MTLKNMLDLINKYDNISIHNDSGRILFNDKFEKLLHSEISEYLNYTVDQIRPYHDTLIILLGTNITYPNGVEVSAIDLNKALDYMYGEDRNMDNDSYTDDEKQKAVNYWVEKCC